MPLRVRGGCFCITKGRLILRRCDCMRRSERQDCCLRLQSCAFERQLPLVSSAVLRPKPRPAPKPQRSPALRPTRQAAPPHARPGPKAAPTPRSTARPAPQVVLPKPSLPPPPAAASMPMPSPSPMVPPTAVHGCRISSRDTRSAAHAEQPRRRICKDPSSRPAAKPCACEFNDVQVCLGRRESRRQRHPSSRCACVSQQGATAMQRCIDDEHRGRALRAILLSDDRIVGTVWCTASANSVGGNMPPSVEMRRLVSVSSSILGAPWVTKRVRTRSRARLQGLPHHAAHQPHAPQPNYTLTLLGPGTLQSLCCCPNLRWLA